ncbi:MAG: GNAT family N-acetyltransferase [Alphaproteobacteria bacterium]|nr:GNAT family N-acetyltransferase [Alphaproteobacteria bacterium]
MNNGLNAPVELSTAHLLLRKPRLEDAAQLFRGYACDREIVRFLGWQAHKSEDETLDFLRHCLGEWSNGTGYPYVIEIGREPASPVGMIHLHMRPHRIEIGYVIARQFWGQGYMTEALSTLVDWWLDQPPIHKSGERFGILRHRQHCLGQSYGKSRDDL